MSLLKNKEISTYIGNGTNRRTDFLLQDKFPNHEVIENELKCTHLCRDF